MKQLTEQQILDNWNKLIKLIEDTFQNERKDKLLEMYKYFEDRMSVAPASGKAAYHNAMVGGYVEHVLHVTKCALQIKELWESNGIVRIEEKYSNIIRIFNTCPLPTELFFF